MNTTEERFDVVIFHKETRKIESIVGRDMRRWDGTGSGRNTVELREETARERINGRYDVAAVLTGKFNEGDILPT